MILPDSGQPQALALWDFPEAYRSVYLNDKPSPGLCVECAGSNPRKWDKKDGSGTTGATLTFNGEGLASFSAKIQIGWEGRGLPTRTQQLADWIVWARLLAPPTEKNHEALTIWYPTLVLLPVPISRVIVADEGVKGPRQVADGVIEFEVFFLQYRKAKAAAAATPKGGTQKKDEFDSMIDDLTKQVSELAK